MTVDPDEYADVCGSMNRLAKATSELATAARCYLDCSQHAAADERRSCAEHLFQALCRADLALLDGTPEPTQ